MSTLGKMLDQPGRSIPELAESWSECKSFYRLLDESAMTADVVFEAHREGTLRRASGSQDKVLLAIQDTTSLNFTSRKKLEGQGPVGKGDKATGLHLHNTLLVGAETGRIFGLLGAKIYARDGAKRKKQAPGARNREGLEDKESYRWVESFELAAESRKQLGAGATESDPALVISVGDREADIYELLKEASEHRAQGVGLLVRSQHNRALCEEDLRLWERLAQCEEQGRVTITVPRSRGMKQREAELSIRYDSVELMVPAHKKKYLNLEGSVRFSILELKEQGPKGLHWRLLTTEEIRDVKGAKRVAGWYAKRWQVEVLHRVLKTGCRVEDRQMREMDRLKPMIALDLVTACYLMGMATEARSSPDSPASEWLDAEEIKALEAYHQKPGLDALSAELTVAEAVRWIAGLGGHLGRKGDGPPGAEVLWRGLQKLHTITMAWRAFRKPETSG